MYIFCRTKSLRPTFHLDMTDAERALMGRHVAYWSEKAQSGHAVVFGPVLDPKGVYGIGVYQVRDEDEFRAYLKDDPANRLLEYEFYPMPKVVVGVPA
jgi:uncharacterized protein